mgnify:CR=1 FL=1
MTKMITLDAFGKNDIRGIYGEDVTEEVFYYTGKGFVKFLSEKSGKKPDDIWVSVTWDARTHSPALVKAVTEGVTSTGANVVKLGLAPTPIGYFSEANGIPSDITCGDSIIGAMIITASHNPSEYNGMKMTYNKSSLSEEEIKEVKQYTQEIIDGRQNTGRFGVVREYDIIPQYQEFIEERFSPNIGKGIKIVVDSANATGGVVAPALYRALGCEVVELYSEPDGTFPNHHPNPSDDKTLDDIKAKVVEVGADFGIAFDGDSDRIGAIDSQGRSLTGDKLLLIYAMDVISEFKPRGEKPIIVSEVKCSQVLYDTINKNGGEAIMCKTGHGYIKSKMKETGSILAGEMSGHTFFKDRYFGFDDAVYAGCRLIEIVAKHKQKDTNFKLENLLGEFDKVFTSQEVRYRCPNDKKRAVLEALNERVNNEPTMFGGEIVDIVTIDGMRVIFEDGFALIRQSNTEPVFTLRFEAANKDKCEVYQNAMISALDKCMEIA